MKYDVSPRATLVSGGVVVDSLRPDGVRADVLVDAGVVVAVGAEIDAPGATVVDASGALVTPGLVQTHVHLCQTVFRGLAEDLDVMSWLDRWIWPLEQLLTAEQLRASARWGVAEMLLTGTTSFVSMETVHHTDEAFAAAEELGARATIGKAMMDRQEPGTVLHGETSQEARAEVARLVERWHGSAGGRLRVALSPRAPSAASDDTWAWVARTSEELGLVVHTHVGENRGQSELVAEANSLRDVEVLERHGALGPLTVLAHCVWLSDAEVDLLRRRGATVAHCPTANLKLGSGIADVPRLLAAGVHVGLGIDGAACNNGMGVVDEMRMAALVHRARGGAAAVTAAQALHMATVAGARALGLDSGFLEPGRLADVAVLDAPGYRIGIESAATQLAFGALRREARHVLVGGEQVVRDHALVHGDARSIIDQGLEVRSALVEQLQRTTTGAR